MAGLFFGIDIGTSGVRCAAFNTEGRQVHSASRSYPIAHRENAGAEQSPDQIFGLTLEVIREAAEKCSSAGHSVEGMGFCSQMHSLLAADGTGKAITPLFTWADLRAAEESDFIEKNQDITALNALTGCRIQHPMYPVSKLLWIKRKDPETFAGTAGFPAIKDYILHRLTGTWRTDMTTASCQGLYNIHTHD